MTTSIQKLRGDFPVFHAKPDWTYLDTAATSQVPQQVIDAMAEFQCAYRASVHRGLYKEAIRATEVFEGARASMARFIGAASADEIIFTSGATGSSNMLVYMLEHSHLLTQGDEIVTTIMEHHASLVPLQEFGRRKHLRVNYIPLRGDCALDYKVAREMITERTKIVSVMLASNVLGTVNNVRLIARRAHEVGALVICDATVAVGHMPVDVSKLGVDFLYFSGHKMCGPTGVGVLYGREEILQTLEPGFFGGGMIDDVLPTQATWATGPMRFEAGTPNISGVIGLASAADYLTKHKLEDILQYVEALVSITQDALREIPGVHMYTAPPTKNAGIVSFTVDGVHPHDMAEIAARNSVAVRAGHHCALPLHKQLEIFSSVRASYYLYNTKRDVDRLVESVKEAKKIFKV